MNDTEPDTPSDTSANAQLGLRIAVGVVGLALLALIIMLGSVAMKHSSTAQALETRESLREDAGSAPARE